MRFLQVLIFLSLFISITANAQDPAKAERLFLDARDKAFKEKDFKAATAIALVGIKADSNYVDLYIFLGRLYGWQNTYDSAAYYFQKAAQKKPAAEDIYIAWADLERWNNKPERSLSIIQQGLNHNPASIELLMRKARLEMEFGNYPSASITADSILQIEPGNTEARQITILLSERLSKNKAGISAEYTSFDRQFPDPWIITSIFYTRETKHSPMTARVNYAQRFNQEGWQYEAEAYPRLSPKYYAFLNAGYSENVGVFPKWKAAFSIFAGLPKAFEAEAGIRYLYFTSETISYTAGLSKYYKRFLFSSRAFITPLPQFVAQSYTIQSRYYYGTSDDFISLALGTGISPDDRVLNIELNKGYKLKSYRGEIRARKQIGKLNIIEAGIVYMNQEYLPSVRGNQYQLGLGYTRKF
jgi:YaiO family outer membrane protein